MDIYRDKHQLENTYSLSIDETFPKTGQTEGQRIISKISKNKYYTDHNVTKLEINEQKLA